MDVGGSKDCPKGWGKSGILWGGISWWSLCQKWIFYNPDNSTLGTLSPEFQIPRSHIQIGRIEDFGTLFHSVRDKNYRTMPRLADFQRMTEYRSPLRRLCQTGIPQKKGYIPKDNVRSSSVIHAWSRAAQFPSNSLYCLMVASVSMVWRQMKYKGCAYFADANFGDKQREFKFCASLQEEYSGQRLRRS